MNDWEAVLAMAVENGVSRETNDLSRSWISTSQDPRVERILGEE